MELLTNENFIESLKLPVGVEARPYKGMNRCHFVYNNKNIASLDVCKSYYHLRAKEEDLRAVNVTDYTIDRNHPSVPGTLKQIPLDDTEVFYKLVDLIIQRESGDINVARLPLNILRDGGFTYYICPRCKESFKQSSRCPKCGQLIKE